MSNAARELSKLTLKTANTWSKEPTIHSTNNSDSIRPEDVAHAIAGLKRGPYLIARLKYALDETCRYQLKAEIISTCIKKQLILDWLEDPKGIKQEKALKLIDIAIYDITASSECVSCQGKGYEVIDKENIECPICGGTGKKQFGRNEKAAMAGINPKSWGESWTVKYSEIIDMLHRWESTALGHIKRKLS